MINIESVRRVLGVADAGREPYGVADVANSLLMVDPGDRVAEGCFVRALVGLKLLGAVKRLMPEIEVGVNTGANSGVIGWGSRARRFGANVGALELRDARGAALVREAAATELGRYELHLGGDGNYQVLEMGQSVRTGWVGGLRDHKASEALFQYDRSQGGMPAPVGFDGVGFGWMFLHALKQTERSFLNYSCAFYVLESDPAALAMLFHMHDLREVIGQERVRWFVRGNREEVLGAFRVGMEGNAGWTLPGQFVRCGFREREGIGAEEVVKELGGAREARAKRLVEEAKEFYAGKDAGYWAGRFEEAAAGRGERLRVLGITSRYTTVLQHSMAELEKAVCASGAEMRVAMEGDDQSTENPCLEMIAEWKPDLIVQISRMRYEHEALPGEVPFLCWDQDNLPCMRTEGATGSLDDLTYVAGHGATYGYMNLGWGRESCLLCAAGASYRYGVEAVGVGLRERFACDVSYVSNASGTVEELAERLKGRWGGDARMAGVFNAAVKVVREKSEGGKIWEHVDLLGLVEGIGREKGVGSAGKMLGEMVMDLHTVADRCFRHATLGWVARWCRKHGKKFRLYGKGWEGNGEFAEFAGGSAEPGEEVRAIYQGSGINLQLIEGGFLHSRALDGLAAGGFFLARRVFNDGDRAGVAAAHHALGVAAGRLGLRTIGELEGSEDGEIKKAWGVVRKWYEGKPGEMELRGMNVWAAGPGASLVFGDYWDISFEDEAGFGMLAEKYLGDEKLRREVAARMRGVVLERFSYDARWRELLAGIRAGLEAKAGVVNV